MNDPADDDLRAVFAGLSAPPSLRDFAGRQGRSSASPRRRSWRGAGAATLVAIVAVAGAGIVVRLGATSQPSADAPVGAAPPARSDAAMAYDSTSSVTVMFGGVGGQRQPLADTWEWDGRAWSFVTRAGPPAMTAVRMTDDPVDRGVLLVGTDALRTGPPCPAVSQVAGAHAPEPFVLPCASPEVETWLFSAATWRSVPGANPAPTVGATLSTVPTTGEVVAIAPSPAGAGCTVADEAVCRGQAAVPGGAGAAATLPTCIAGNTGVRSVPPQLPANVCGGGSVAWQTWVFRAGRWFAVPSELVTGSRTAVLLTVVGGQDKLVVDAQPTPLAAVCGGGACPAAGSASAWTWNGDGWTPAGGVPAVPALSGAVESTTGTETLVYTPAGDTWEGSPAGWTERSVFGPSDPGPRVGEAMARDRTGHVVMFGGYTPSGTGAAVPTAATWTWDGTGWVLASGPPPR